MKCKLYLTRSFALLFVLLITGTSLWAQSKTVQGTVTDVSGAPVIGVSVTVKGTSTGTSTDGSGKYSLRVPNAQAVLEFNFLGYVTQEIIVGDKMTVDVTLAEDAENIDEVVVIGYGTVRKRDLTGSVASVGGEEIAAIPVANVAQALQGKIAGVSITTADGRPDAGMKIRVRGGGSITQSNDPLYVVDGFPVDNINDIPSSQIESINILKDASSTAIYGARGANGVVLITTKTPTKDRLTISYDGYYQIKTLPETIDVLEGSDYVKLNWELYALSNTYKESAYEKAFALGAAGTQAFKDGIDAYKGRTIDWMDRVYGGTASAISHNVNISGGNERTNFNISYSSLKDDGLRMNSWLKRQTITAKLNQKILDNVNFSFDSRFTDAEIFGSKSSTNSIAFYTPVEPLGDISPATNPEFNMNTDQVNPQFNPEKMIQDAYNMRTRKNFHVNGALSWEVIKGLTIKSEYGVSYGWNKNYDYSGPLAMKDAIGLEASIERKEIFSSRFVNTINYQVQGLGDQHRLDFLLGQELTERTVEDSKMTAKGLPKTYDFRKAFGMISQWSGTSISDIIKNVYETPDRMSSFFVRANYSLKDRYLLTATFRADGSSKFHPDNRWGYFPAAAAAWRINAEPFMQNATWIDNLKLRVSYGQVGNNRIDPDQWRSIYKTATGGYPFNNQKQGYYTEVSTKLVNPDLKWETTITRNVGVDFAFFNNRLYGTIEGYWNTTKDLLLEAPIFSALGYELQQQNIGKTRNTGIEFSIGGDIIRKKDFLLSANFNIAHNKNKIESLGENTEFFRPKSGWGSTTITPQADYEYRVGGSVGLIRGYVTDGYYTTDDFTYDPATKKYTLKPGVVNSSSISALPGKVATGQGDTYAYPGALKLKKLSANNPDKITEDDITVIGNTNPKHIGGFNLNAVWKNFDAMLAFNWSYGNDIYNANKVKMSSFEQNTVNRNADGSMSGRYRLFDDFGNRVHDPAALDALNQNATIWYPYNNNKVVHSWCIEDGSYLRLNNVTVGYTIPQHITKKFMVSKLRVYATVYNVWTWTNYTGLDPEVDSRYADGKSDQLLYPGLDYDAYPRARTFTFGVNLVF